MHFNFKNRLFLILRSTLKTIIIDYLRGPDRLVLSCPPLHNWSLRVAILSTYFWTWIWTYSILYFYDFMNIWVYYVWMFLSVVLGILAGFFCCILSIFLIEFDWILNLLYGLNNNWPYTLIIHQALYDRLVLYLNFQSILENLINFRDWIALFLVSLPETFQLFIPFSHKISHILKHLILTIDNILLPNLLLLLLLYLKLQKHCLLHESLNIFILSPSELPLLNLHLLYYLILLI